MRLTIQNYKRLIGEKLVGGVVENVVESEEWYSFLCRKTDPTPPYGQIHNVRLSRDGINEGGVWKFRFWRPVGMSGYNQVTADWFGDMRNALKAIESELNNQ